MVGVVWTAGGGGDADCGGCDVGCSGVVVCGLQDVTVTCTIRKITAPRYGLIV